MFHKIESVEPLENFILFVVFKSGEKKYYDVKQLFETIPAFKDLINITGLFKQVKVDTQGYGIFWNEYIDLSGNELWENGELVNK